jgi:hypothetical protein
MQRTVTAMAKVGIPPEQRDSVFATVAAVLHLGNVSFVEGKESDSSAVAPGSAQEHLQAAGEAQRQLAGQQPFVAWPFAVAASHAAVLLVGLCASVKQGVPQQWM